MSSNEEELKINIKDAESCFEKKVDNKASIKEIIKAFSQRAHYSKSYRFYNQLVVPRIGALLPHYLVPGYPLKHFEETWDGTLPPNYFEPFPFKCTMPKVITAVKNINESDPVTQCLKIKKDWQDNVVKYKKFAKRHKVKLEYLNDEVCECPKYMIDFASILEDDPDANFDSTYNWYYSGNGNMQLISVESVHYLLHSEMNSVYLSRFHISNLTVENCHSAKYDCEKHIYILETICMSHNIVVLRTKNKILVLKIIQMVDSVVFEEMKIFESDSIFTSVCFDKHHANILYVTTIDSKLTIVNIDRMTGRSVKLRHHYESLVNNWNCVMGAERGTFMHVERNAITQYDKRTNNPTSSWAGLKDVADLSLCNEITAALYCKDSPSLYFATNHLVYLMDTRASKKTDLNVVQRWIHGLRCAPTIMSIGKSDDTKEFICVTSQWCEDMCVISNYSNAVINNCQSIGVSMPYHPPSIVNLLNKAHLNKLCFDIWNPINTRIATATTGMAVIEQNENCCILTHNALGDIYLRTIYPQHMETFIQDDSVDALHKWSQSYKIERKTFEVSGIVNIAQLWRKLKKLPDTYCFQPQNNKDPVDVSEVFEAFKNEEFNPELLDVWMNEQKHEQPVEEASTSIMLNLHYEDSDDD